MMMMTHLGRIKFDVNVCMVTFEGLPGYNSTLFGLMSYC